MYDTRKVTELLFQENWENHHSLNAAGELIICVPDGKLSDTRNGFKSYSSHIDEYLKKYRIDGFYSTPAARTAPKGLTYFKV
jgi:hypothetical protein